MAEVDWSFWMYAGPNLYVCPACFAAVSLIHQGLHREWHERTRTDA